MVDLKRAGMSWNR